MGVQNLSPFLRNIYGVEETIFLGHVQAGATQQIKTGEICCFKSGYWQPITVVSDGKMYRLAVCKQEQKVTDLERYIEFIAPKPGDQFAYLADSVRAVNLGDGYTLTAGNSQQLTYSATAFPVFKATSGFNLPGPETNSTAVRQIATPVVEMNPECSFYGVILGYAEKKRAALTVTGSLTLDYAQSGLTFLVGTDALVITLPPSKEGIEYTITNDGAAGNNIITIQPDQTAPDAIKYQTSVAGKDLINTKATSETGDSVTLVGDGNGNWRPKALIGIWAKQA